MYKRQRDWDVDEKRNAVGGASKQLIAIGTENLVSGTVNKYLLHLNSYINFGLQSEICLSQGQQFFSWNNIGLEYTNQTFSITWINGVSSTVTIPAGQYQISDISGYIQFAMRELGWYLVDDTSTPHYYISLVANPVYNKVIFTSTVLPETLAVGWTYGTGTGAAWTTHGHTPQLTVLPDPQLFSDLIGMSAGTYPANDPEVYATGQAEQALFVVTGTGTTFTIAMVGGTLTYDDLTTVLITGFTDATHLTVATSQTKLIQDYSIAYSGNTATYQVLGDYVPTLSPVSTVSINCNLVSNPNTPVNNSSLWSFNANGFEQRQVITYNIPEFIWLPIILTQTQDIVLTLTDQTGAALVQTDTNANWVLYIRQPNAV